MSVDKIYTNRLVLEPFKEHHLSDRYVEWLNDPMVTEYSELRHRHHTIESCKSYYHSFIGSIHFFWAILLRSPKNFHIGNITAHIDFPNLIADLGILIGEKNYWGNGFGLEAWQAVLSFLFKEKRIRKITAGTLATNSGMIQIMRRSGMKEDGLRVKHFLQDNKAVDVIHYCIFNDNF